MSALEEHFDAWSGGDGAIPLPGMGQPPAARGEEKATKDIGDVIEAYLAQVSRAKDEEIQSVQRAPRVDNPEEPPKPDTLEDVPASRRAATAKSPGPPRRATAPERGARPASSGSARPASNGSETEGRPRQCDGG